MYKLIISDLDETLLQDDKHVSFKDKKAIDELEGCRFAIASGRGFVSIQEALKEVGLYDRENSYSISLNGAVITENKNNRIISCVPLTYAEADRLFSIAVDLDLCTHIYTPYQTYVYRLSQAEKIYVNGRIELTELEKPDLSFLKGEDIIKILYVDPDMEELKALRKRLDLEDLFSVTMSANRYLEFNHKGTDKGKGLRRLCDLLNIDISETIAVGDSLNDKEMLEAAGLSVCVANAVDEIRQICDVILKSDNNHSPISEVIDRFIKTGD